MPLIGSPTSTQSHGGPTFQHMNLREHIHTTYKPQHMGFVILSRIVEKGEKESLLKAWPVMI
jgi:hypothetical protein